MKEFFKIETKQTKFLEGAKLESIQDVLGNIALFDLIPPFNVFNERGEDVTAYVMDYAKENNYKFVDREKTAKLIPAELKKIMNQHYKKVFSVSLSKNMNIKLVHSDDIKSINGFYELWEHKCITIGTSGAEILFIDTSDAKCPVYCINKRNINDFSKKELLSASVNDFAAVVV